METIRAELSSNDTCSALGITAKSDSPALALRRKLIDACNDPATPLEALPRQDASTACQINRLGGRAEGERQQHRTTGFYAAGN